MSQQLADSIKRDFEALTNMTVSAVYMPEGTTHFPTTLRDRTCGVYAFLTDTRCFKVGKAGPKSKARWNSHHYNLDQSTPSTLPKSILYHVARFKMYFPVEHHAAIDDLNRTNIQQWVRNNLARIELLIEDTGDKSTLNLLEAIAQYHLKPLFEGKHG